MEYEPRVNLWQIKNGRLYVPVQSAVFGKAAVHRRDLQQIARFPYLEDMSFQDCRFDRDAVFLAKSNPYLRDLALWNTVVLREQLHGISGFTRLTVLYSRRDGIEGELAPGRCCTAEPKLLSPEQCRHFRRPLTESLAVMKQLTCLQIPGAKIDRRWAGPRSPQELEALVVDDMHFNDEDLRHLASLHRLKVLFLDCTAISDDGMASIESFPNLEFLVLSNTNVTDQGLRSLSKLHRLEKLDIMETRATNACLKNLAAMRSLKTVRVCNSGELAAGLGFIGVVREGSFWYRDTAAAEEAERRILPEGSDDNHESRKK